MKNVLKKKRANGRTVRRPIELTDKEVADLKYEIRKYHGICHGYQGTVDFLRLDVSDEFLRLVILGRRRPGKVFAAKWRRGVEKYGTA